MSKSSRGRYFEDFTIGETLVHATPRTVSEGDQALYTALYGARFAPQAADSLAQDIGLPAAPLDDLLVFHVIFGKSVPDISLNAVANLGYAGGLFLQPVFPGDTLSAVSEVIGMKENSNGKTGVLYVETVGRNQVGEVVLRFFRWVMVNKREGAGALVLVGLGVMVVGYIGVFFGKLIKSAVSRQREFLADASAVQFTRNPDGIAGALKKIGGYARGSRMRTPNALQASHLFFANGLSRSFVNLLATHPQMSYAEAKRQATSNWLAALEALPCCSMICARCAGMESARFSTSSVPDGNLYHTDLGSSLAMDWQPTSVIAITNMDVAFISILHTCVCIAATEECLER